LQSFLLQLTMTTTTTFGSQPIPTAIKRFKFNFLFETLAQSFIVKNYMKTYTPLRLRINRRKIFSRFCEDGN
jgi:hypothetical protein